MATPVYRNLIIAMCLLMAALVDQLHGTKNVKNLKDFNATDIIQAEDAEYNNFYVYTDCGAEPNTSYVGSIYSNTVLSYPWVSFGSGVETITIRVFNYGSYVNYIYVHLGLYSNPPIAMIPVGKTGGYCSWYTITAFLDNSPSNLQDLYFTFPSTVDEGYFGIDWFYFNQTVY